MYEQPGLKCYSLGDNLLRRLVECVMCVESIGVSAAFQGCSPINNVNCTDVFCCYPTPITATLVLGLSLFAAPMLGWVL